MKHIDQIFKFLLILTLPVLLLAGCALPGGTAETETDGDFETMQSVNVYAMDTTMTLKIYGPRSLLTAAAKRIAALEKQISVTDPESDLYAINETGSGTLTGDAAALMARALALAAETDGIVDPTIYPVVRAWGFTTGNYRVPSAAELDALLPLVDYTAVGFDASSGTVTLPQGAQLDFGALAKGYIADVLCDDFAAAGVSSAVLSLGGNVQTLGTKPDGSAWRVAIQDPGNSSAILGVVCVADQCVITTGGYQRYFEQDGKVYCHVFDPATGEPADSGLASVSIIGTDGTRCDALSTALFVMGLDRAADFWRAGSGFEAVLVTDEGQIYITEGLTDSFAPRGSYADSDVQVITR